MLNFIQRLRSSSSTRRKNIISALAIILIGASSASADDSCENYANSVYANDNFEPLLAQLADLSSSNGVQRNEQFVQLWAEYTLENENMRKNPLTHIILAYEAIELDFLNRALTALEFSFILVNRSELCENAELQYFIYAARVHAVAALMRQSTDDRYDSPVSFYELMTNGNNHPFSWLSASDFALNKCLILQLPIVGVEELTRELIENCQYSKGNE